MAQEQCQPSYLPEMEEREEKKSYLFNNVTTCRRPMSVYPGDKEKVRQHHTTLVGNSQDKVFLMSPLDSFLLLRNNSSSTAQEVSFSFPRTFQTSDCFERDLMEEIVRLLEL